ncbi:MAG: sulfurtransferase TusA family protein [Sporichthyaceae bacterium]
MDLAAPDVVIDGSGLLCVSLLLRLRAQLSAVPTGAVVHVIATDPAASLDLPAWCHLTGHQYLGDLAMAELPTYALRVSAEPRPTHPDKPWHLDNP